MGVSKLLMELKSITSQHTFIRFTIARLKELGGSIFAQTDNSERLKLGAQDLGYASLKSGDEASNVNITDELTSMIKAQQQFNGSARLMQTNSEMVERLTR